jgi:hypothetical protein
MDTNNDMDVDMELNKNHPEQFDSPHFFDSAFHSDDYQDTPNRHSDDSDGNRNHEVVPGTMEDVQDTIEDVQGTMESSIPAAPSPSDPLTDLYNAFRDAWTDDSATMTSHLKRGKDLALAFLEENFLETEDFFIQPERFSKMAKYGWTTELQQDSKKKIPRGEYTIPRECVDGFVVCANRTKTDDDGQSAPKVVPHTYFAIMAGDISQIDRWPKRPLNPRTDVVYYSMAEDAQLRLGYCFLLLGPRLEIYRFDRKKEHMAPLEGLNRDHVLDLRTTDLSHVRSVVRTVCAMGVTYQNGDIGPGPGTARLD